MIIRSDINEAVLESKSSSFSRVLVNLLPVHVKRPASDKCNHYHFQIGLIDRRPSDHTVGHAFQPVCRGQIKVDDSDSSQISGSITEDHSVRYHMSRDELAVGCKLLHRDLPEYDSYVNPF